MARDLECMKEIVAEMLIELGYDLEDPHIRDTPRRYSEWMLEATENGFGADSMGILSGKVWDSEAFSELIVVTDIKFASLCAHHLIPFDGYVDVGYVPNETNPQVVGLSKIARVVLKEAQGLQVQEDLTSRILKVFNEALSPAWIGIRMRSKHGCVAHRGIRTPESNMSTLLTTSNGKTTKELARMFRSDFLALSRE